MTSNATIRLYDFARGAQHWRFTNADRDIIDQTKLYSKISISDDGVRQTGETSADEMTVTAPWDLPVARLFRGIPPSDEISLVIRELEYGDTTSDVDWVGTVTAVRCPQPGTSLLSCRSLSTSFKQSGLSLTWERGCPYALYDHNCKVNPLDFAVPATITAMDGATIESAEFDVLADSWFNGGFLEWEVVPGVLDRRGIETHVGGVLALFGGTAGLAISQAVTGYPGCKRTIEECHNKFNNKDNYGGIPHLPGKSPFDGSPVF